MKKLSVIAIVFLLIFESCKKEDSEGNYHVSFTVDGVNKTYTGYVLAHTDTSAGYTTLTILGANSATSFDNNLGIYLDNYPGGMNITPGQYEDNFTDFTLLTTYTNNGVSYEAGQTMADNAVAYNVTIPNHFKLNIISMDNNTIKGTFSGDYFQDGDVQSGTRLNITNGDFYVKFQ